jgi:UDP-N-acetylglucosamine 2-epimerase
VLAGARPDFIVEAAARLMESDRSWANPFGDGHSGTRIVSAITAPRQRTRLIPMPINAAGSDAPALEPTALD